MSQSERNSSSVTSELNVLRFAVFQKNSFSLLGGSRKYVTRWLIRKNVLHLQSFFHFFAESR